MKHFKLCLVALLFALISSNLFSQDSQSSKSNYVTIGVFRVLDNAIRSTENANKNGFTAQYAINPKYNLYYVYLLSEGDKMKAYNFMSKIRKETNYKDAWIFVGTLGKDQNVAKAEPKPEPKVELKPEPKVETKPEPKIETPIEPKPEPKVEPKPEPKIEPKPADSIAKPAKEIAVVKPKVDSEDVGSSVVDSVALKEENAVVAKKGGKPFYFKVVSKEGKELSGHIQLQEAVGATQYRLIRTGHITYIEAPKNKTGEYEVATQIPGFKESKLSFGYHDPKGKKGTHNEEIITITVEKASKGDYIDFNNVHFFKNTSIMQAQSQKELDGLVTLMNDNPKYKIKIYGYVNGKKTRETITMGTSTSFFALDNKANKRGMLSSKELSLARAETAKAYLVKQGINSDRISTKGEGGAVPLYAEDGTLAHLNDRIEVEFVKSK